MRRPPYFEPAGGHSAADVRYSLRHDTDNTAGLQNSLERGSYLDQRLQKQNLQLEWNETFN